MAAVPYAELAMNVRLAHGMEELDVPIQQEIIIAAIHKPLDGAELGLALLVGFFYVLHATVIYHGLGEDSQFIARGARRPGQVFLRNRH